MSFESMVYSYREELILKKEQEVRKIRIRNGMRLKMFILFIFLLGFDGSTQNGEKIPQKEFTAEQINRLEGVDRTYMTIAVSSLVAAIVFLVLYIRSLHTKQLEREKENLVIVVNMAKDFMQATKQFEAASDAHTKSSDRLIEVVDHMHKNVLDAINKFAIKTKKKETHGN